MFLSTYGIGIVHLQRWKTVTEFKQIFKNFTILYENVESRTCSLTWLCPENEIIILYTISLESDRDFACQTRLGLWYSTIIPFMGLNSLRPFAIRLIHYQLKLLTSLWSRFMTRRQQTVNVIYFFRIQFPLFWYPSFRGCNVFEITTTFNRRFCFKQLNSPKNMLCLFMGKRILRIGYDYLFNTSKAPAKVKEVMIRKGFHGKCPGFPLKIPGVHRLWLAGKVPTGWRSLQPECREPVASFKTKTGKQDNRFSPLLLTPDSYHVSGGCTLWLRFSFHQVL